MLWFISSGWSLGEHGEWSKYSNFEVSTKVPLIFYDPRLFKSNSASRRFPLFEPPSENHLRNDASRRSNALVELVDVFPTLADFAGLPSIPLCPETDPHAPTCAEGLSFAPVIESAVLGRRLGWKSAAFAQYPRPSLTPQTNSDQPRTSDVKFMGYSMRTERFRYTEWLVYDPVEFRANWSEVFAVELYDHRRDVLEDDNVAEDPRYGHEIRILARKLRNGWRCALPRRMLCNEKVSTFIGFI